MRRGEPREPGDALLPWALGLCSDGMLALPAVAEDSVDLWEAVGASDRAIAVALSTAADAPLLVSLPARL